MQNAKFAICLLFLTGCADGIHFPGKPDPAKRFVRPDKVSDFDTLFNQHCRGCHGNDGQFGPAPPLNDPLFLAIVPDTELEMVITHGREHSLMTAFGETEGGPLREAQVDILVKGIRQRWAKPIDRPKDQLPEYYLNDSVKKAAPPGNKDDGAKVFENACAPCHGRNGKEGMSGSVNDVSLLALLSDQELRRIVITGRPDFGMPDYRDPKSRSPLFKELTAKDINDVVALLVYWRQQAK